jgi:vacuolar protein sorting-associated protein 45
MVSGGSKSDHFKKIKECLEDNIKIDEEEGKKTFLNKFYKLKLAMIFCLRYEDDKDKIKAIQELLKFNGVGNDQINMIRKLLNWAGNEQRIGDLFSNKTMLAKTEKIFKKAFKQVDNIFLQHKPKLTEVLNDIIKCKLSEND